MNILYEAGSLEWDASARSFIVSVTQPVRHSFACHVSCKVKYFGKVANAKVRIRGGGNVPQHCRSMNPTAYQLWIIVDHERDR